jgi:3-phosphoshikimate 1-carboxyvinyltransferase
MIQILREMGIHLTIGKKHVEIRGAKRNLKGIAVDLRDTPDLAPICAALACLAQGTTVIEGVSRLHFKESDRIFAIISELRKMGGDLETSGNNIIINGSGRLHGAEIDPHNDHRIAMACAVAALQAEGRTVIHGIECINKSYPNFIKDLISLGGKLDVR